MPDAEGPRAKVTVCVGSSCHVRGSRAMLKRFAEVIGESAPADHVSLVGSFCMERCGKGMNWRFDDEDLSSASVEEAAEELRKRLSALAGGGT